MLFHDRTVLITGASSGLGEAIARAFVAEGARVGLMARREDKLRALQASLTSAGGRAAVAVADVADYGAVQAGVRQIADQLGPIDILIANAGIADVVSARRFDPSKIAQLMQINVMGVTHAIAAVLPSMLERRQGHLVGISSLSAVRPAPRFMAYGASKACVSYLLNGLRMDLADKGVDVTVVQPGFIRTEMTESMKNMPMIMEAGPAASAIIKAVHARRRNFSFPRPMYQLLKLTRWLPDALVTRILV